MSRDSLRGKTAPLNQGETSPPQLTPRIVQVIRLISLGCTTEEIANLLSLSERTVGNHRQHALELLDAHNTAQLVRAAFQRGITSVDDTLTEEERQRLTSGRLRDQ